jgi:HrpA-like RNA helicase
MVGDGEQDSSNRLIYMTDGLLKTQAIYQLDVFDSIDVLMIDEIHERSANIDMLLLLVYHYCRIKSRSIKIILCSATIDTSLGDLMRDAKLKIDAFEV